MDRFEDWVIWITSIAMGLLLATMGAACTSGERATVNASDVYQKACARCHGQNGRGGAPPEPGGPSPRDFTSAAWQRSVTPEEIRATVLAGKGAMPSFEGVLDTEEIDAAVEVVRSFGGPDR